MQAWKMVDVAHADAVASGRLRIGTLEDYKGIENGRADPADGGLTINSGVLMGAVPEHNAALARMRSTNVGLMVNCTISFRQPPLYAFCMATPGCRHDPSPDQPKAMFQIGDVHRFAELIAQANSEILGEWQVDYVRYESRNVTAKAWNSSHNTWTEAYGLRTTESLLIKSSSLLQRWSILEKGRAGRSAWPFSYGGLSPIAARIMQPHQPTALNLRPRSRDDRRSWSIVPSPRS